MKRYLLFKGDEYYPCGGWDDFKGEYDTLNEATASACKDEYTFQWWHVIDITTGQKVGGQ